MRAVLNVTEGRRLDSYVGSSLLRIERLFLHASYPLPHGRTDLGGSRLSSLLKDARGKKDYPLGKSGGIPRSRTTDRDGSC